VKAITYRVVIARGGVLVVYLLTGQLKMAVGFMIVSNLYTTVGDLLHERIWACIRWGTQIDAAA
jgi:adenylylsulfate kinase